MSEEINWTEVRRGLAALAGLNFSSTVEPPSPHIGRVKACQMLVRATSRMGGMQPLFVIASEEQIGYWSTAECGRPTHLMDAEIISREGPLIIGFTLEALR